MEQFSNWLASDPIYMAVAVVLSLIILFGAIKKLFKIVIVAGALLVLWIAYTTSVSYTHLTLPTISSV